jgi:phosphoribosylamine---glycine ligase
MNILLIGSGGREHALAAKLTERADVRLFAAPGNPGILALAAQADVRVHHHTEVIEFCKAENIALVVIGPEAPLAAGLADDLRAHGIPTFGPSKAATQLESSKTFAKNFMHRHEIPTATYRAFSEHERTESLEYVRSHALPVVIKADGLAAGKGVSIATTHEDALAAVEAIFAGKFGSAGNGVVVEEFMQGEEASVFAICDGERFLTLASAQDHKRVGDGDTGENTGGMGAYAPSPLVTDELLQEICERIITPTLLGMKQEGTPFVGCLYVGLMIEQSTNGTPNVPRVVEFNVRFGDPETQVILSILNGDLPGLLLSASVGALDAGAVTSVQRGAACCVVLAAGGYPGEVHKGDEITGIAEAESLTDVRIFHAGTEMRENAEKQPILCTNGGRVLGVTSHAATLQQAINASYAAVERIDFQGKTFRTDIGAKGVQQSNDISR